MLTPSGRFQTDTRLCLSMSDFHPESWNPLWSVGSILTGLLSFMVRRRPRLAPRPPPACCPRLRPRCLRPAAAQLEETPTTGSTRASRAERQRLARDSLQWNRRRPMFVHMFPDLARRADEERAEWEKEDEARKARQANAAKSPRGASAGGVIAAAGRAVGAPAAPFLETWGLHIFGVLAALVAVLTALLFR